MTGRLSKAHKPNLRARAFLILSAVGLAVAIPILPLRFLGIPGPDFSDMAQVVTTSKNWLSQVASKMELKGPEQSSSLPINTSPAEQVKMLDAAAQQLNAEIEKTPADPALQNRLGLVHLSLGDIDRACEHFQKAVSLARQGIASLSQTISTHRQAGNTKEASTALLEASKLNVELSAAHSNLARVFERRGEHEKVIAELDLLNREGILFNSNGGPSGGGERTPMLSAEVAKDLARAEALLQARQYQGAATEFKKVIAQNPNVAMPHHRLGTILAMSGNPAMAIDELEAAARLDSASPEIHNDLGLAYQMMGLHLQAVKAFERSLALEPRQTEAAINLSNIYSSAGKLRDAIAVLTQAIQSNPNSAKAHNNLGSLFAMEGKSGPAMYEFQKAVSIEPRMPSAHYGLGTVLMQTKSYLPAVREFKQALALNPGLVDAQLKIEEASRRAAIASGSAQAIN